MHAEVLDEPELEFGGGNRYIDPRFGIATYGPADLGAAEAPRATRYCAGTLAGYGTTGRPGVGSPRWYGVYGAGAVRHLARDAPGLAPQTRWQQVRHEQAAQARPLADVPGHRPPGRSPGKEESGGLIHEYAQVA